VKYTGKKVSINSLWMIADRLLRMAIGIFIGGWTARVLSPEGMGELSYTIALVTFFVPTVNLGVDSLFVKKLVDHQKKTHIYVQSLIKLRIKVGLAVWLSMTAIMLMMFGAESRDLLLVAITGAILPCIAFDAYDLQFQASLQSKKTVIAKSIAFFLVAILRITLLIYEASVEMFALAFSIEAILGALALVWMSKRDNAQEGSDEGSDEGCESIISELVVPSVPIMTAALLVGVYTKADQLIVSESLGTAALGQYAAAIRLTEVWQTIAMAIVPSFMPLIASAKKENDQEYKKSLVRLFRIMFWIGVAIATVGCVAAGPVVRIIFGSEFDEAGRLLQVLIWTVPFQFLGIALTPWTINEGLQRYSLIRAAVSAVVSLALNFSLTSNLGVIGACYAALAAQITSSLCVNLLFEKTRPVVALQIKAILGQK
jgi:O-antigen/teichoic acid export membrane protein